MNPKRSVDASFVIRLSLLINIVSLSFVAFMMYRVDDIIHQDMYNYGLTFNLEWAVPMWSAERLIFICSFASMFVSAVALGLDFWNKRNRPLLVKQVEPKPGGSIPVSTENHIVISCPKCRRTLSKPLVVLDFSSKKARLVNVCPYCNQVLGEAKEDRRRKNVEVGVLGPDEKIRSSEQPQTP